MNVLTLVFKQMRQRSLSTWLTLLSVLLGVGLAVAIMILRREGAALFGQTDYGYDVLIGAKGSPLQLVINTVYHIDKSPGNIPYSLYEAMLSNPIYHQHVQIAVPFAVGDSYKGLRIVGTLPELFGYDDQGQAMDPVKVMEYRPGKRYHIAEGRIFAPDKFEAIIGSRVSRETGLKMGDTFQATHGLPRPGEEPDIHKPKWTVVGVLQDTRTAADRALYIPLISFYTIAEHDVGLVVQEKVREGEDASVALQEFQKSQAGADHAGHHHDEGEEPEHYTVDAAGHIHLDLPRSVWGLSGIMIKTPGGFDTSALMYQVNHGNQAAAVNPATEMRTFFANFLSGPAQVLLLISLLVTIVAGVAILVSIYNSVSARLKEIAILRALGATRARILSLICLEAGLIGLIGGVLGFVVGHLLGAAASAYFNQFIGEGLNWIAVGPEEILYLVIVVGIALLAGLVPALKAYRTPVATNLVAG